MACAALLVTFSATWATAAPIRILVLGDSLASGYGLEAGKSFPARLELVLRQAGHDIQILNAGVPGDTTAGGLARLDWSLAGDPHVVVVELGGNDGLRGIDPRSTYTNLDAILTRLKSRDLPVLLTGMIAPPNMGNNYVEVFNSVFPLLAQRHGVMFYPFILDGVAGQPELLQDDGIHPNQPGVTIMVDRLMPHVVRLIVTIE